METQVSKLDQYLIDQRNKSIADFKANVSETAFNRVMSVIKALEATGKVKTDISVYFDKDYVNDELKYRETWIGFNKSGNQGSTWDWFKVCDWSFNKGDKVDYRGVLEFKQSYSQIIGRTEKGWKWGYNVRQAYKKRFDIILDQSIFY